MVTPDNNTIEILVRTPKGFRVLVEDGSTEKLVWEASEPIEEDLDASRVLDRLVPFVIVDQAVSIVGSSVSGRVSEPADIDILLRWYGGTDTVPDSLYSHLYSVIKSDNLHFITEPAGPHSTYLPIFDFVFVPDSYKSELLESHKNAAEFEWLDFLSPAVILEDYLLLKLSDNKLLFSIKEGTPAIASGLKLRKLFPELTIELARPDSTFFSAGCLVAMPRTDIFLRLVEEPYFEPFKTHKSLRSESLEEHDPIDLSLLEGKKLDLGCGDDRPAGWIGLDIREGSDVDIVWNAEDPLPFDDNEFSVVRAHHFLEHISDQEHVMCEIYRVLEPDGSFVFETPSWSLAGSYYWIRKHLPEHGTSFTIELLEEFQDDTGQWCVQGLLRKPSVSPSAAHTANFQE